MNEISRSSTMSQGSGEERFAVATLPSVLVEYGQPLNHDDHVLQNKTAQADRSKNKENERYETENSILWKNKKQVKKKSKYANHSQYHEDASVHRHGGKGNAEKERLEWVADTWDQAKAEILAERHELLTQKVELQHALLKVQDKRARLRRELEEQALQQKRAEEKQARNEKIAALQGQFKQSLVSERKPKRKSRPNTREAESSHADHGFDTDGQSSEAGSVATSGSRKERTKTHAGYLPSDTYAPSAQPVSENDLAEKDEEEEQEEGTVSREAVTPADLNSVPWHHAQLYRMYGRNADYYIHPKMQEEKKKVVHPTLKRQRGHLGAGHIWTTLRSDSTKKLLRNDRRFPKELKEAFGSHVRDGITKHKKPVFRNFTETEDVPDLPRLLDQSLLRRIRVLRHKTELMYRSSQTNHDRTKILLFNSPLPDVGHEEEGIGRFLSSWDFDTISDTTEASYMRWLKKGTPRADSNQDLSELLLDDDIKALGGNEKKGIADTDKETLQGEGKCVDGEQDAENSVIVDMKGEMMPERQRLWHPESVLSPLDSEMSDGLHDIWHRVMARQRPRRQPKYHFLTEAEARTPGDILSKLGLDPDRIDRGRTDLLPQLDLKSQTSRRSLPNSVKAMSAPKDVLRHSVTGMRSDSAEKFHKSQDMQRYESRWQPLSMQALVEYKEQLDADGMGEYSQGRPPMWRLREATAATD